MARSRDAGYVSAFEVGVAYTEIKDESYKSHSVSRMRTRDRGYVSGTTIAGFIDESFEPIATTTLTTSTATVIFSSIPATYKHLQIRGIQQTTGGVYDLRLQVNSDTGNNYATHRIGGYGTGTFADATSSTSSMKLGLVTPTTSVFGGTVVDILDYANTNKYKTVRSLNGYDDNGSGYVLLTSGLWQNTNAITSLTLSLSSSGNFLQHSQFALYGIKG